MDTDVLVVGAGPTGLMLANQLARHGVRPLIVDRHSGPAQQTRAIGVQARTLEIYAKLGVVDRALELGKRGRGANIWAEGRRTARIPIADIGNNESRYPFILMLGQDDNEAILGERLRESGTDVQWNTELVALEQRTDHVIATLRTHDGGTRTVSAAWVGGCDGSRSAVREFCGIAFPGAPYEHVFFVADTVATGDMIPDEVNVYLWKEGFHLFFPMHGQDHWRVIGILPANLQDKDNLTFDDVVPHVRGEAGRGLEFKSCTWFSTYRISHRRAARFRDKRCFLLGDAAHIHSPMGAQGMNTGLQDAYNLGWKLALVASGQADAALLESYEQERLPVAQRLLHTTDRAFMLVVKDTWIASLFRTRILARVAAFAMQHERVRRFAFRTISQLGIRYPESPLSRKLQDLPDGAPQPGDRFPWLRVAMRDGGPVEDLFEKLDDTRFNLLVIGQPEAGAQANAMVRTHVIPATDANAAELARAGVAIPSFYLLRPDGHVGLAGARLDLAAVSDYLASNGLRLAAQGINVPDRIEKTILLRAPLARLWRAISDPKEFGAWFGVELDGDFAPGARVPARIVPTQVDPAVAKAQEPYRGFSFEIAIERVEPMRLLSFRWHPYAIERGVDYSSEPTTLVTFELEEAADGTRLAITESGFERIPLARRAKAFAANEGGWQAQTRLVEKYLAREP
jgi:2-polyprenyl-6-methoxyphenol hydroxylase-like FAD-dependent oxidoreductase/uncharacterized protein YndB with AHSA1/START domain